MLPIIQSNPVTTLKYSPDQRFIASGSFEYVKIWEAATGRLIRTIPAPNNCVTAFSPDNKLLLTGTTRLPWDTDNQSAAEVRLWNTETGAEVKKVYEFGEGASVESLEFNKNGQYFMMSSDEGQTLVWNLSSNEVLHTFKGGASGFFPDGKRLYLSDSVTMVADLATGVLGPLGPQSPGEDEPPILKRLFLDDVILTLYTDGRLTRWSISENREISSVVIGLASRNVGFNRDGSRVVSIIEPEEWLADDFYRQGDFAFWDTQTGEKIKQTPMYTSELTGPMGMVFGFWGLFSADLRTFIEIPKTQEAEVRTGMLAISTEPGKLIWEFGDKRFESTVGKRNVSGLKDTGIYNGGEVLRIQFSESTTLFYPETGKMFGFSGPFPPNITTIRDDKWVVDIEDNMVYTISEKATGTVKARLLLADDQWDPPEYGEAEKKSSAARWAVTTPSGLFDASADMMNKLHFVVGMESIGLDQLKARYHEPGLLSMILGSSRGQVRDVSNMSLASAMYPVIDASISNGYLNVTLTPREGKLGALRLAVNGKTQLEDANPDRKESLSIDLKPYDRFFDAPKPILVSLVAENQEGWLESGAYNLDYIPLSFSRGTSGNNTSSTGSSDRSPPSLYVICIGTSKYRSGVKSLTYPDLDAAAMAKALGMIGKGLFEERVAVRLLSTAEGQAAEAISSKENIRAAFMAISDTVKGAKPQDIVVVYFSGHGATFGEGADNKFYYLTKDVTDPNLKDPEIRKNFAISTAELTEWLTPNAAQKQVLIFDACHSGKAAESLSSVGARALSPSQIRALDKMKDRTGMFILSGSAANELSFEASEFGQGLLTYSLLHGISGAAIPSDQVVDVMTLFQYSRDEVPVLAKRIREIQVPVMAFPLGGASFPIGIKKPGMKIPIAEPKPVFIRNEFQDEDFIKDTLGLGDALAEKFLAITARGAQASMIYVDTKNYENAYSIHGRYSIAPDGAVTVTCRLFKGSASLAKFVVKGKKDAVPQLAQAILAEVPKYLPK